LAVRRRIALGVVGALVVAGAIGWFSLDKETRGLLATLPTNSDVLFWSQPQRDAAFRALDRLPVLARSRVVPAGGTTMPLPPGPPLRLPVDVDAYMAGQRSAALLIVHDGKLRLERYGLGFDNGGRWTSFSMAKSVTSTLVGAALKDGQIRSMDDKVSVYIREMKGSAYDDVSIRQLLTMTSGVKWNEDYADPNSDVARFNNHEPEEGVDSLVSYLRKLPREAPAGTRWLYSTGETNLVGVLLGRATKKDLATYLAEKIWVPAGMEQPATWILSKSGREISGCCIQAAPRDFARLGVFILNGARIGGQSIVPDGWLADATTERVPTGRPGRGYGYQWWTYDDGSFAARGIFGQGIFLDPKRKVVIVSNANWGGGATDRVASEAREAFYRTVLKAVDDEAAAASSPAAKP
jgi:CubicO group peptidase (beta-lactamase class C family)